MWVSRSGVILKRRDGRRRAYERDGRKKNSRLRKGRKGRRFLAALALRDDDDDDEGDGMERDAAIRLLR